MSNFAAEYAEHYIKTHIDSDDSRTEEDKEWLRWFVRHIYGCLYPDNKDDVP